MFLSVRAKILLWIFTVMAFLDGIAFTFTPDFVSNGAYAWAGSIISQKSWGIIFLCSFVLMSVALILDRGWFRVKIKYIGYGARIGMLLYGLGCMVFGASILILTLDGTTSAITGTTKWWLPFVATLRFVSWPSIYRDDLVNTINIERN